MMRRAPAPDGVHTAPVGYVTGAAWQGIAAGLVLALPVWAAIIWLAIWIG